LGSRIGKQRSEKGGGKGFLLKPPKLIELKHSVLFIKAQERRLLALILKQNPPNSFASFILDTESQKDTAKFRDSK
jgi:hypothetical protein